MPIVTQNLMGYWNCKSGISGTTWKNLSPNTTGSYDGTFTGDISATQDRIYFSGTNTSVEFPSLGIVNSDFTVEVWLKPSTGITSSIVGVVGLGTSSDTIQYRYSNPGFTYLMGTTRMSNSSYPRGNLIHLVLRYRVVEDSMDYYINNKLDSSFTDTSQPSIKNNWNGAFNLGRQGTGNRFVGDVYLLRVYNKFLSDNEINQNYNSGFDVSLEVNYDTLPGAIASPLSNVSTDSVDLSWGQASKANYYIVRRNGVIVYRGTSQQFTDIGLKSNTSYTYSITAENNLGEGPITSITAKTMAGSYVPVAITEDFSDDAYNFNITGDWIRTPSSLTNKDIGDRGKSTANVFFSIPQYARNGKLSYYHMVSSEKDFDFLTVSLDGIILTKTSGIQSSFSLFETNVSIGDHAIKIEYSKDSSTSEGSDSGFIDSITVSYDNYIPEPTPTGPPSVTSLTVSSSKISKNVGKNITNITFKFDQDVAEWKAVVFGTGPDSGVICDSGGAVPSNVEILAVVDSSELYQEGSNRINIYGKNSSGLWTPYEGDGTEIPLQTVKAIFGNSIFGKTHYGGV